MTLFEAKKEQLPIIQELARTIWPVAYGKILPREQLDYMLDKFYSISSLENLMNCGQVFLLVQEDEKIYGFASYELNCSNTTKTKIHKLYVLPATQRIGLGKKFVDFIKKAATENNNTGLFLNVNRFNKAVGFYQKLGFTISESVDIEIGNGYLMEDFVMEILF